MLCEAVGSGVAAVVAVFHTRFGGSDYNCDYMRGPHELIRNGDCHGVAPADVHKPGDLI